MNRSSPTRVTHRPSDIALDDLTRLAERWESGTQTIDLDNLSRQQFQALCVAVGRPQLLMDPVRDFNRLPESLRSWALEFASRGDRQQRVEQHKQMCAWANAGTGKVRQDMLDRLAAIADRWAETGVQPRAAGPLSRGEYAALCLSLNETKELSDPIHSFLHLDGWLQEWVLHRRGWPRLVGLVIGHPECY